MESPSRSWTQRIDRHSFRRADPRLRCRHRRPRESQRRGRCDHEALAPRSSNFAEFREAVDRVAIPVARRSPSRKVSALLGLIHLKDVVKPGINDRFEALRAMGIRTVMVTGDNPITAAAIASEAGVDDFLAEATPNETRRSSARNSFGGRLIAMCGDGTERCAGAGPGRCRRRDAAPAPRRRAKQQTWSTSTATRPSSSRSSRSASSS